MTDTKPPSDAGKLAAQVECTCYEGPGHQPGCAHAKPINPIGPVEQPWRQHGMTEQQWAEMWAKECARCAAEYRRLGEHEMERKLSQDAAMHRARAEGLRTSSEPTAQDRERRGIHDLMVAGSSGFAAAQDFSPLAAVIMASAAADLLDALSATHREEIARLEAALEAERKAHKADAERTAEERRLMVDVRRANPDVQERYFHARRASETGIELSTLQADHNRLVGAAREVASMTATYESMDGTRCCYCTGVVTSSGAVAHTNDCTLVALRSALPTEKE